MDNTYFYEFLKIVLDNLPLTIQKDILDEELERNVLFIKSKEVREDSQENGTLKEVGLKDEGLGNNISNYEQNRFNPSSVAHTKLLNDLLDLLDDNLGSTYRKVSEDIYDNKLSWKANKLNEMQTENLIYVYYYSKNKKKIILYMSFMLTEEFNVSQLNCNENVIYLYEIQIMKNYHCFGLGTLMMEYIFQVGKNFNQKVFRNMHDSIKIEKDEQKNGINSIALTVFADNNNALKFYKKLGFKLTIDSPIDEIVHVRKRTRMQKTSSTVNDKEKRIKPIYYLLYCPLPN